MTMENLSDPSNQDLTPGKVSVHPGTSDTSSEDGQKHTSRDLYASALLNKISQQEKGKACEDTDDDEVIIIEGKSDLKKVVRMQLPVMVAASCPSKQQLPGIRPAVPITFSVRDSGEVIGNNANISKVVNVLMQDKLIPINIAHTQIGTTEASVCTTSNTSTSNSSSINVADVVPTDNSPTCRVQNVTLAPDSNKASTPCVLLLPDSVIGTTSLNSVRMVATNSSVAQTKVATVSTTSTINRIDVASVGRRPLQQKITGGKLPIKLTRKQLPNGQTVLIMSNSAMATAASVAQSSTSITTPTTNFLQKGAALQTAGTLPNSNVNMDKGSDHKVSLLPHATQTSSSRVKVIHKGHTKYLKSANAMYASTLRLPRDALHQATVPSSLQQNITLKPASQLSIPLLPKPMVVSPTTVGISLPKPTGQTPRALFTCNSPNRSSLQNSTHSTTNTVRSTLQSTTPRPVSSTTNSNSSASSSAPQPSAVVQNTNNRVGHLFSNTKTTSLLPKPIENIQKKDVTRTTTNTIRLSTQSMNTLRRLSRNCKIPPSFVRIDPQSVNIQTLSNNTPIQLSASSIGSTTTMKPNDNIPKQPYLKNTQGLKSDSVTVSHINSKAGADKQPSLSRSPSKQKVGNPVFVTTTVRTGAGPVSVRVLSPNKSDHSDVTLQNENSVNLVNRTDKPNVSTANNQTKETSLLKGLFRDPVNAAACSTSHSEQEPNQNHNSSDNDCEGNSDTDSDVEDVFNLEEQDLRLLGQLLQNEENNDVLVSTKLSPDSQGTLDAGGTEALTCVQENSEEFDITIANTNLAPSIDMPASFQTPIENKNRDASTSRNTHIKIDSVYSLGLRNAGDASNVNNAKSMSEINSIVTPNDSQNDHSTQADNEMPLKRKYGNRIPKPTKLEYPSEIDSPQTLSNKSAKPVESLKRMVERMRARLAKRKVERKSRKSMHDGPNDITGLSVKLAKKNGRTIEFTVPETRESAVSENQISSNNLHKLSSASFQNKYIPKNIVAHLLQSAKQAKQPPNSRTNGLTVPQRQLFTATNTGATRLLPKTPFHNMSDMSTKINAALKSLEVYLKSTGRQLTGTSDQHFLLKIGEQHVLVKVPPAVPQSRDATITSTSSHSGHSHSRNQPIAVFNSRMPPSLSTSNKYDPASHESTTTNLIIKTNSIDATNFKTTVESEGPEPKRRRYTDDSDLENTKIQPQAKRSSTPSAGADTHISSTVYNSINQNKPKQSCDKQPVCAPGVQLQYGKVHPHFTGINPIHSQPDISLYSALNKSALNADTHLEPSPNVKDVQHGRLAASNNNIGNMPPKTLVYADPSSQLSHIPPDSRLLPTPNRQRLERLPAHVRAARRAALEKKYPLPPGVIIKSEPDDIDDSPENVIDENWSVSSEIHVTDTPADIGDSVNMNTQLEEQETGTFVGNFLEQEEWSICNEEPPPLFDGIHPASRERSRHSSSDDQPPVLEPIDGIPLSHVTVAQDKLTSPKRETRSSSTTGNSVNSSVFLELAPRTRNKRKGSPMKTIRNIDMGAQIENSSFEEGVSSHESTRIIGDSNQHAYSIPSSASTPNTSFKATDVSNPKNARIQRLKEMLKRQEEEVEKIRKLNLGLPQNPL